MSRWPADALPRSATEATIHLTRERLRQMQIRGEHLFADLQRKDRVCATPDTCSSDPDPKRLFPWVFPIVSAPTPAAEHRRQAVRWLGAHGGECAPRRGTSDTRRRRSRAGPSASAPASMRSSTRVTDPRLRRPTTPSAVVLLIRQLREQYPRCGREKLRVLLALREPKVVRKADQRPEASRARTGRWAWSSIGRGACRSIPHARPSAR